MGIRNTIRQYFEKRAVVLMYHRISDPVNDPWELCVSPENFEQQLQVLSKRKVVPLRQMTEKLPANGIAITFDDGYIDNYTVAKPLLEKYNLPATFFITPGQIAQQVPFWWDELGHIVGDPLLYLEHWKRLLPLTFEQQQHELSALRSSAGLNYELFPEELCMHRAQLKVLAANKLFDLGVHTVSHPALAYHDTATQHAEIVVAREWLQKLTGEPVNLLAYPYGIYNETTINIAAEQQFDAAFTTDEQTITRKSGKYKLGRFQVKNWTGQEFAGKLEQWLKNSK